MALISVDNVGQVGIVKEKSSWNLPPNVWSDGNKKRLKKALLRSVQVTQRLWLPVL